MSLFSHFSQNIFGSLFGKRKTENKEATSREIRVIEDTSSEGSIPSFSVLNHSNTKDYDYLQPSSFTKRENIFFGKDIESNDTNEIINYNLKKLRKHQGDVMTSCIDASGELISPKSTENECINRECECEDQLPKNSNLNNNTPSLNVTLTNIETDNNSEIESDLDSDSNSDTDSNSNSDSESETDSNNTDVNSSEKCILYLSSSPQLQQQQPQKNKIRSKHSSMDDIILEDLDLDKLIYNVPPPFIKVSNPNSMNTIPLKKFTDSMSMPANLSKFSTSTFGHSYTSRNNILSRSLGVSQDSTDFIPGIKTIELKKSDTNSKLLNIPNENGRRRHSTLPLSLSLSNKFSPKDLSAPLSSSVLAIQYEQPSLASLIDNESNTEEEISDYPLNEREEEYDIFDYDL